MPHRFIRTWICLVCANGADARMAHPFFRRMAYLGARVWRRVEKAHRSPRISQRRSRSFLRIIEVLEERVLLAADLAGFGGRIPPFNYPTVCFDVEQDSVYWDDQITLNAMLQTLVMSLPGLSSRDSSLLRTRTLTMVMACT